MLSDWIITNDYGGKEEAVCLKIKHRELPYEAYIKWDGCVEITKYVESGSVRVDYQIHICDVPGFIKMLQSLEDFRMANIKDAE